MEEEFDRLKCKGCASITNFMDCPYPPVKNGKLCPCLTCLVKSMCSNPCDEFHKYKSWNKINKLKRLWRTPNES